jgi:hypothetical protein
MNRCFVVTQGASEVILLQNILRLPEANPEVRLVDAGGRSSAESLARSILAAGRGDVALVVDAEVIDPILVEERKRTLRWYLAAIAAPPRRLVVVIEPEIEAILFKDRRTIEGLVEAPISDTDLVRGEFEPRKVLGTLLGNVPLAEAFSTRLPQLDLTTIRMLPSICELREFVRTTKTQPVAA